MEEFTFTGYPIPLTRKERCAMAARKVKEANEILAYEAENLPEPQRTENAAVRGSLMHLSDRLEKLR